MKSDRLVFKEADDNLVNFLREVKYIDTLGFYGKNLDAHLGGNLNDRTLVMLFEFKRADLANA